MVDIVELRNIARRLRQWAKEIRLDSLPAPYATNDEDAGVLEKAAGEPAETRANQLESSNAGPIAALDTTPPVWLSRLSQSSCSLDARLETTAGADVSPAIKIK
jgi:hypothetical protein